MKLNFIAAWQVTCGMIIKADAITKRLLIKKTKLQLTYLCISVLTLNKFKPGIQAYISLQEWQSTVTRGVYINSFECRSFRQRSFRKRLWSVRKRVEVSSQTFRSQFANVINIYMCRSQFSSDFGCQHLSIQTNSQAVDRWDGISSDGGMSKSSSLVLSAIGMESSSAQ